MPSVSRMNNGSYRAQSLRSYIATDEFYDSFFSYTVNSSGGSLGPVLGASPNNCLKGRVLRETGRKLFPGANLGITQYLVGVYDSVSLLNGFIDPNDCVFAVFNTDKPNYLPDNGDKGPSVYTCGKIEAEGDMAVGGNLTVSGDETVENLTVNNMLTVGGVVVPIIANGLQPRNGVQNVIVDNGNVMATSTITADVSLFVGQGPPVWPSTEDQFVYANDGNLWVTSTLTTKYLNVENFDLTDLSGNVQLNHIECDRLSVHSKLSARRGSFDNLSVHSKVKGRRGSFRRMSVGSSDSEHSLCLNVHGKMRGRRASFDNLSVHSKVKARRGSFGNLSVHSDASFHGNVSVHGNMSVHEILTAFGYNFRMGSDRTGSVQLSSGSATVSSGVTCAPSSSVLITIQTPSNEGFYNVVVGSNAFTITSSNGADASLVNWIVLN